MIEEKADENELGQIAKEKRAFRNKIIFLSTGTIVTLLTFLLSQYASSFVTYAYYNKDQAVMGVILEKITNIEDDVREIKIDIRAKKKTGK